MNAGIQRVAATESVLGPSERYVEGQRDSAERIRAALATGDKALAERIAHTVKGVSGNIGAADAQAAAAKLEASIRQNEANVPMESNLTQFSLEIGTASARIRSALDGLSPSRTIVASGKRVDASELMTILQTLAQYARESDSEAFEYLDSVRDELASSFSRLDFDALEAAMKSYNFAEALQVLQRFSQQLSGSA